MTQSNKMNRREAVLSGAALLAGGAALLGSRTAAAQPQARNPRPPAPPPTHGRATFTPVVTPNVMTLPWTMENGVKVFRLVAEPVKREFAPGMVVNTWGYNGQCPGPTIEAVEGDRVRFLVTNKLPERTSVHWHGVLLPNGMDGVAGLNQPHIGPGETFSYEFTLRQHGTQMYHPHSDEMVQMAMGMMGFFIIHPKKPETPRIDRDFCIFLAEWFIPPGAATPNPSVMLDFNIFTFNARAFPGTAPLVVRTGDAVPGNALALNVKMLKSSITEGLGVAAPGGINHSARKMQKSRSIRGVSGFLGWMMKKPIIPIAICTISSECGWYIWVPCWRSVNS